MTIISEISKKYNWWTQKKDTISEKSQIESILLYGTLQEIIHTCKSADKYIFVSAFDSVKSNSFSLSSRRKGALETIIKNYDVFR